MASFLFDNDADMRVGRWLIRRGHSVTSALLTHLDTASDREILLLAGRLGLIVVTHNESHFTRLHRTGSIEHAGILALPQPAFEDVVATAEAIERLIRSDRPLDNALYRLRAGGWQAWNQKQGWVEL